MINDVTKQAVRRGIAKFSNSRPKARGVTMPAGQRDQAPICQPKLTHCAQRRAAAMRTERTLA